MKRILECPVCGKDRCSEVYCFRMGKVVYRAKNGQVWWTGKDVRTVHGVEGGTLVGAVAPKQVTFDFGGREHNDPTACIFPVPGRNAY